MVMAATYNEAKSMDMTRTVVGRWVTGSADAKRNLRTSVRRQANKWLFRVLGNGRAEMG
jgi:hypothetical protein